MRGEALIAMARSSRYLWSTVVKDANPSWMLALGLDPSRGLEVRMGELSTRVGEKECGGRGRIRSRGFVNSPSWAHQGGNRANPYAPGLVYTAGPGIA
jgi:hypothetical protein